MKQTILILLTLLFSASLVLAHGTPTIPVDAETAPSPGDDSSYPIVWLHPDDPAQSLIITTDEDAGIVAYDLDGKVVQVVPVQGEASQIDLRYRFSLNGEPSTLIALGVDGEPTVMFYTIDADTCSISQVGELETSVDDASLCMYFSPITNLYYVFHLAEDGTTEQYELSGNDGEIAGTLRRSFSVGGEVESCTADDLGNLFIGEEAVAIWKYGAEPDADKDRVAVDTTDADGHLTADVEGLALYYAGDGAGYLIASSQGSSEYAVYARENNNAYVGKFVVTESPEVDGTSGTDGIDVTNAPLGAEFLGGVFVAQDDTNINPDANQNFKLVSWEEIARAMNLVIDTGFNPRDIGAE